MPEFYVNSNLTPREAFSVHGALPDSMIETLIAECEDHREIDMSPVAYALEQIMLAEDKLETAIEDGATTRDIIQILQIIQTAKRQLEGMEP